MPSRRDVNRLRRLDQGRRRLLAVRHRHYQATAPPVIEQARADGKRIVTVPDAIHDSIAGGLDVDGVPMLDLGTFHAGWSDSFEFDWVEAHEHEVAERRVFDRAADVLRLVGGLPKAVRAIRISRTMRPNVLSASEAVGLWDAATGERNRRPARSALVVGDVRRDSPSRGCARPFGRVRFVSRVRGRAHGHVGKGGDCRARSGFGGKGRGMTDRRLVPHSTPWFEALVRFNPDQVAHTAAIVRMAGRLDVCSVCGDDPAADYWKHPGWMKVPPDASPLRRLPSYPEVSGRTLGRCLPLNESVVEP